MIVSSKVAKSGTQKTKANDDQNREGVTLKYSKKYNLIQN